MQRRGVTGTGASSPSASPTLRSTLCLLQKLLSASFKVSSWASVSLWHTSGSGPFWPTQFEGRFFVTDGGVCLFSSYTLKWLQKLAPLFVLAEKLLRKARFRSRAKPRCLPKICRRVFVCPGSAAKRQLASYETVWRPELLWYSEFIAQTPLSAPRSEVTESHLSFSNLAEPCRCF